MNILEIENLSFSYGGKKIIENLNFSIDEPKYVSILGKSGCGKTTLFKLILSLLKAQNGHIFYKGEDVQNLRSYAGYMPQKDLLLPWRSIRQNVSLALDIKKVPKKEKNQLVEKIVLDMGLIDYIDKMPHELSGGMRQRASFARTILTNSNLLLFDEPLSALDYITRMQLRVFLLNKLNLLKDKTAIFITHDVEEAIFLSDTIYLVCDTPIRKLIKIDTNLPKDRSPKILEDKNIIKLKNDILSILQKGVEYEK